MTSLEFLTRYPAFTGSDVSMIDILIGEADTIYKFVSPREDQIIGYYIASELIRTNITLAQVSATNGNQSSPITSKSEGDISIGYGSGVGGIEGVTDAGNVDYIDMFYTALSLRNCGGMNV